MVEGRLSTDLPYAKEYMLDLLKTDFTSQAEALEAVAALRGTYEQRHPEAAAAYPEEIEQAQRVAAYPEEIEQAQRVAEELVTRLVFEEPGVTWESFPDQNKHKDFAGCFRCHNGKHLSEDGESIRLQCNICHSVPETVGEGDRPPQMPLAYIQEPDSHLESNFVADHRFQADESCEECHGPIEFGTDDSSFCANSACHDRAWPEVELDAAFPHPIELEGKHAEAWCHDCHNGERQPEYVCSNCHEPPEPHFGSQCEDCHTPDGFEGADMGDFQHPVALEGAHASADCADCHAEGKDITSGCAGCHEPPPDHFGPDCEACHTPTSFKDASLPPEMHPVELVGAHQSASCDSCHVEGQETPAYVCSNCHEAPEDHLAGECDACHAPIGFEESAAQIVGLAPEITHELAGRDDCLMCHDPEGQVKPAPSNHADYANEQCALCHKAEE
jgi:hypothetical protein